MPDNGHGTGDAARRCTPIDGGRRKFLKLAGIAGLSAVPVIGIQALANSDKRTVHGGDDSVDPSRRIRQWTMIIDLRARTSSS